MYGRIRQAGPADAPRVVEVIAAGRVQTYRNDAIGLNDAWEKEMASRLKSPRSINSVAKDIEAARKLPTGSIFLVCDDPAQMDLSATMHALVRKGEAHLNRLFTLPTRQNRGLGTALMERYFDWAPAELPQTLEVVSHNRQAIKFYQQFDFEIRPDSEYLWEGIKTVVMERKLKQGAV